MKTKMKKFYFIFILQIFIAQFAVIAHCEENTLLKIEVQSFSLIESKEIHLGDIARITGAEPRFVKIAQSIVLTSAPVRDRSLSIKNSLIKKCLLENGFDLKKITLDIPDKITVKNKLTRISEENIKEAIREYIYENMPWDKDEVNITEIAYKGDIILPPGEFYQNITMGKENRFIGKISLDLELTVNGKIFTRRKIGANINVLMPVVLTKVNLEKNQIISENDLYIDTQWKSKLPSKICTSIEQVAGKKLTKNIKAGLPLNESFLEIPDDIFKGDKITILAKTKTFQITAPGIAEENGKNGETIKVKNLDSKKIIYAKVINNTTVKIDL